MSKAGKSLMTTPVQKKASKISRKKVVAFKNENMRKAARKARLERHLRNSHAFIHALLDCLSKFLNSSISMLIFRTKFIFVDITQRIKVI